MGTTQERMIHMSAEFQEMVDQFFSVQCRYQAAIRELTARLEVLDDEFQMRHRRNPIHSIQSRMKSIQSMMEKLRRKGMDVSIASAVANLNDIAGVRVVCSYIHDIYFVAGVLTGQEDLEVVAVRDYIQQPKTNGYRSLHLVLRVPVYLSGGRELVPVEVQIRTIAMDFWASLEHNLRYKAPEAIPADISEELLRTAGDIAALDERMQRIHDRLDAMLASQKES